MKKFLSIILLLSLILAFSSCESDNSSESKEQSKAESKTEEVSVDTYGIDFTTEGNEITMEKYETTNPVAALLVEGYGTIVLELYPDIAPNTVNNFISLIKKGFYDGNTMHRMIPGFVIQGGDPDGLGSGGPGYSIKGEFSANGFENNLKHERGVLSMARSSAYDSAGSQFFIMFGTASHLDGQYAAFGKVIEGYDVLDKIESIKYYNTSSGKLVTNLKITKAVVDTKGVEYPEPEIIK